MIPRWEHFEHGADVGVRGLGDSKAEAFAQAALAMTAAVTDPALVRPVEPVEVRCTASDDDLLLVDWLNRLIYEMATRRMLFSRFDVRLEDGSLSAHAWGEGIDRERHHPAVEAKGATLTAARVARHGDGWLAQTVIDV
jgi:SHS2 domain-containing protein